MPSRRHSQVDEFLDIHILGVPMDHGAGRRGVGMGPSAMRIAGLHEKLAHIGHNVIDHGDVIIRDIERAGVAGDQPPTVKGKANHLPLIARACDAVHEHVKRIVKKGGFPVVIGGDHSIAMGTISGLMAAYKDEEKQLREQAGADPDASMRDHNPTHAHQEALKAQQIELTMGVIWIDAHGDLNTPDTSPSGNIHGMPLAAMLGEGPKELTHIGGFGPKLYANDVVLVGIRDIDRQEKQAILDSGAHAFTMKHIDERGMAAIMRDAIDLATRNTDFLHVSFDIDSVDPRVAPGTGTAVSGGLTYREAHLAMEMISESGRLTSIEMVEVNPILDVYNQTGMFAVDLLASALGKSIL